MEKNKKINHLIVDSGAFILNSPIQDLGEMIYTLPEVVDEIKDKATISRLQCLPYEILYREPSGDDLKTVTNFARMTGDLLHLSATDLKLMALTLSLEKQFNGDQHLRNKPIQAQVVSHQSIAEAELRKFNNGFYGFHLNSDKTDPDSKQDKNDLQDIQNEEGSQDFNHKSENQEDKQEDEEEIKEDENEAQVYENQEETEEGENQEEAEENQEEKYEEELSDDEDGWITKSNIDMVKKQLMGIKIDDEVDERISVGCLTGDFAMQNVLLQMGLKVVSIKDGLCIKETRQFVFRCHACFKLTTKMTSQFCPHCGNSQTLKRVAVTVKDDGTKLVHINFRKPINIRGTKYSLPAPKSGKHVLNPILVADQPLPQQRKSKFAIQERKQLNANKILTDPDYVTRSNPFAINDVYSRGSRFTTNTRRSVNPNETRKSTGNRKKKSRS